MMTGNRTTTTTTSTEMKMKMMLPGRRIVCAEEDDDDADNDDDNVGLIENLNGFDSNLVHNKFMCIRTTCHSIRTIAIIRTMRWMWAVLADSCPRDNNRNRLLNCL